MRTRRILVGLPLLILSASVSAECKVSTPAADPCPPAAVKPADSAASTLLSTVSCLRGTAQDPAKPFLARLGAIDSLGKVPTNDDSVKKRLLSVLRELLAYPNVEFDEKNVFFLHVVQAIAAVGQPAYELVCDLNNAKGNDRILDDAIDAAKSKLEVAPAATKTPATAMATDIIAKLQSPDPSVRLAAALVLASPGAIKPGDALQALLDRMALDCVSSVRLAAAASAAAVLLAAKADPAFSAFPWTQSYVFGLTRMLVLDKDPAVRLTAAQQLGKLGADAASAYAFLCLAATRDCDHNVSYAARAACQAIQPCLLPGTPLPTMVSSPPQATGPIWTPQPPTPLSPPTAPMLPSTR